MQQLQADAGGTRGAEEARGVARARRMAWGLGLIVLACYIGFMVFTKLKGSP